MHAVAWLLIGSIRGVLAESQFTIHVGERLRFLLSTVLFASAAKLVAPNGSGWLVASGAFLAFTAVAGRAVRVRDGARVAPVAPRVD